MPWAPDYVTPFDLGAYVRIPDGSDDAQMSLAIAAASRAVDLACGRQFGQEAAPVARVYTARAVAGYLGRWVVEIDDLMTAAGMVVDADLDGDGTFETALSSYTRRPLNALVDGRPWTQLAVPPSASLVATEGAVRVTARWGWSAVPEPVRQACMLQASRLFARRNSPFGIAGSPEAGSELRLLARVDPDVEVSLRPFKRHRRVVFA